jgi:ketosteroid isomerase-like protein
MKKSLSIILLITVALITTAQQKSITPELLKLVNSERAFSQTSVQKGVRASFVEFFADDGINFTPHPGNAQENFRQRPAPTAPQPFTLKWEPIYADISQAGDLGFTTGPVVNTDNENKRPPRYSYYFSIWKKQPDNNWKVLIDYGTSTPSPADPSRPNVFVPATAGTWRGKEPLNLAKERRQLLEVERELATATQKGNVSAALSSFLADETRMHRDELTPLVGSKPILDYINQQKWSSWSYEPIDAGVSQSADLGYTYGKYELIKTDVAKPEKGYLVRVWKRNTAGAWKLVADIGNALPE